MWAKIDDRIFDNPKIAALSPDAKLTYLAAIVQCNAALTDGVITEGLLPLVLCTAHPPLMGRGEEIADELVAAGLWDRSADGWVVHDWLEWNLPADEVRARAEAEKERKRRYADRKREQAAQTAVDADAAAEETATETRRVASASARRLTETETETETYSEEDFNHVPSAEAARDGPASPQAPPPQKPNPFEAQFEPLWQRYPRRMYRPRALKAFQALMRRTPHPDRPALLDDLAHATGHYAAAKADVEARHVLHGSTWFGPDEPWRDWIGGNPEPAATNGNGHRPDPFDALAARLEHEVTP